MEEKKGEKQARPKSRQSIAHIPSRSNTTTDIAAIKRANDIQVKSTRSRGKSIGPGGLEALTETSANVLRVSFAIECYGKTADISIDRPFFSTEIDLKAEYPTHAAQNNSFI